MIGLSELKFEVDVLSTSTSPAKASSVMIDD